MWRRFCAAIERPELAADERFASFRERDRHREALLAILRETLAAAPSPSGSTG